MRTYILECWYRYNGSSEKDFEIFEIEAISAVQALKKLQQQNKSYYFKLYLKTKKNEKKRA